MASNSNSVEWGEKCLKSAPRFPAPDHPASSSVPIDITVQCIPACAVYLVVQSSLTLCNPMDYSPPGSSVHEDSPGKNTGVGCHVLLQGMFPTKGPNPGLPHCRQILYWLSHRGSPLYINCSININIIILLLFKDLQSFWCYSNY